MKRRPKDPVPPVTRMDAPRRMLNGSMPAPESSALFMLIITRVYLTGRGGEPHLTGVQPLSVRWRAP